MGIINKHLAKLAEGRTEITTNMISEAEKLDISDSMFNYYELRSLGMQNIYNRPEYYQQQLAIMQMQSRYNQSSLDFGIPHWAFGNALGRCPYCGK